MDRLLLRLMGMEVHSMVYVVVALSVWHGIQTILNAFLYPPEHKSVFFDVDAVNIIGGSTIAILGASLIVFLARNMWQWSFYISMALLYLWACVLVMLLISWSWSGAVVVFVYVILYTYLSLGTSLHHHTGYPIISKRKEHYGSKD